MLLRCIRAKVPNSRLILGIWEQFTLSSRILFCRFFFFLKNENCCDLNYQSRKLCPSLIVFRYFNTLRQLRILSAIDLLPCNNNNAFNLWMAMIKPRNVWPKLECVWPTSPTLRLTVFCPFAHSLPFIRPTSSQFQTKLSHFDCFSSFEIFWQLPALQRRLGTAPAFGLSTTFQEWSIRSQS